MSTESVDRKILDAAKKNRNSSKNEKKADRENANNQDKSAENKASVISVNQTIPGKDLKVPNLLHLLPKEHRQRWVVLDGFSKFTHRLDLLLTLQDFQPLKIDPILDRVLLLPVGKYALLFPDSPSSEQFVDFIASPASKLHTTANYHTSRIINADLFTTMAREGIDDRMVWMGNVDPHIYEKHLYYWLEKYRLEEGKAIVRVKELSSGNLFLLKFVHPDEAIRFVIDKQSSILNGRKINLIHYNA